MREFNPKCLPSGYFLEQQANQPNQRTTWKWLEKAFFFHKKKIKNPVDYRQNSEPIALPCPKPCTQLSGGPVSHIIGHVRYINILMHLSAAIPGGLTPQNPRAFAPKQLQILPTQGQYSSTKSYQSLSPGEHNLKETPNCNIISCIIFSKCLTIIYTVSKNS